MKFELDNNTLYLLKNDIKYTIPNKDIQRLIARPGTRVLRMIDEDNKISSTPLSTPVGEIAGYDLLSKQKN